MWFILRAQANVIYVVIGGYEKGIEYATSLLAYYCLKDETPCLGENIQRAKSLHKTSRGMMVRMGLRPFHARKRVHL